jgi:signal transduction histidine kinase/DNA-binding response OmpR family regulator
VDPTHFCHYGLLAVLSPLAWRMWENARRTRDLRRANDDLQRSLAAARGATELKSRFLANMSHEIRTPIHGVLGMTELLLCTRLDQEQREYADAVRRSAQSLLAIINDILDLSKIEAGKLELDSIVFDVWSAVEEVAALVAFRAYNKSLELICMIDPQAPRLVRGDPARLRQVLTNIAGNAVKFTDEGQVSILVEAAGQSADTCTLRFTVSDTGSGIAPEVRDRIFESFAQGDPALTRRVGGTGLGLAISRHLVKAMGGAIDFESEAGNGSRFWFTVTLGLEPQAAPPGMPACLAGMRVLVVDDKAASRMAVSRYLQSWGCRADETGSAAEALALMVHALEAGDPFRVAVVDLEMPGKDGAWLAAQVAGDSRLSGMLLLALTPIGLVGESARLKECGFASHMPKPVRPSQFYGRLLEILKPPVESDAAPDGRAPALLGTRVLVAEDNDINQKIVLRMLDRAGCRADRVSNGREAVEAAGSMAYDLILMDVQMPEMDGFSATREIRRLEDGIRHTPIAAMTANAMTGDRERCLAAGMDDYISKPVRLADLERMLHRWLGRNHS